MIQSSALQSLTICTLGLITAPANGGWITETWWFFGCLPRGLLYGPKTQKDTLPETNGKRPWKSMVGRWVSFRRPGLLRGAMWKCPINSGFSPQIIHFNRVFPKKPFIFGVFPYFWKHPCQFWGEYTSISKKKMQTGLNQSDFWSQKTPYTPEKLIATPKWLDFVVSQCFSCCNGKPFQVPGVRFLGCSSSCVLSCLWDLQIGTFSIKDAQKLHS